ncbi:hypothetical protein [Deinococcus sp.]|uniref:hypothetical protein n=1 Tax=Deinococcus sp. TaxID=47478 RepID=UPI0025E4D6D5|nr:hypothetical protein [Deinococcus sp.]
MNRTERYLKRATLGLWGRRRREAQMELRGIVEDKLWRFEHLGLTPDEAERRALAELGPARAVAGGLSRVHIVPVGVQGALLLGVLGMLGVQVVASAAGVRATMQMPSYGKCNFDEAFVKSLPAQEQQAARNYLTRVGRSSVEALCRETAPGLLTYLKIDDFLGALKSAGVSVTPKDGSKSQYRYLLKFPGEVFPIDFDFSKIGAGIVKQDGDYIEAGLLISFLKEYFSFPISIRGVENPTLRISDVNVQLGTATTPFRAANVLAPVVTEQLRVDQPEQFKVLIKENGVDTGRFYARIGTGPDSGAKRGVSLTVSAPDNTFYGVLLSQYNPKAPGMHSDLYQIAIRPAQSGRLWLGSGLEPTRLVGSFADLQKAHTGGGQVALLLKITSGGDLRDVKYEIVPPAQVQLVPARP